MTRGSRATLWSSLCLLWAVYPLGTVQVLEAQLIDGGEVSAPQLQAMWARSIGPAGMSGRITAIDAVAADPSILYVGAATGGLWKSVNGGQTWTAIFDDQPVLSIGAVAIDPHVTHRPLQSSTHRIFTGSSKIICSASSCSPSMASPS